MQNYCKVFCQFRTFHSALFCVCVNKAMEMNRIKYWKFHFMHNWIRSRSSSSAGKISAFNFSYLIFPFSHPPIDRLSATLSHTQTVNSWWGVDENSISIEKFYTEIFTTRNLEIWIDFIGVVAAAFRVFFFGSGSSSSCVVHNIFFYYVSNVTDSEREFSECMFAHLLMFALSNLEQTTTRSAEFSTLETLRNRERERGEKPGGNCVKIRSQ